MGYYICKDCGHTGYGNYCNNCRSGNIVSTEDETVTISSQISYVLINKDVRDEEYQKIKDAESKWKP